MERFVVCHTRKAFHGQHAVVYHGCVEKSRLVHAVCTRVEEFLDVAAQVGKRHQAVLGEHRQVLAADFFFWTR